VENRENLEQLWQFVYDFNSTPLKNADLIEIRSSFNGLYQDEFNKYIEKTAKTAGITDTLRDFFQKFNPSGLPQPKTEEEVRDHLYPPSRNVRNVGPVGEQLQLFNPDDHLEAQDEPEDIHEPSPKPPGGSVSPPESGSDLGDRLSPSSRPGPSQSPSRIPPRPVIPESPSGGPDSGRLSLPESTPAPESTPPLSPEDYQSASQRIQAIVKSMNAYRNYLSQNRASFSPEYIKYINRLIQAFNKATKDYIKAPENTPSPDEGEQLSLPVELQSNQEADQIVPAPEVINKEPESEMPPLINQPSPAKPRPRKLPVTEKEIVQSPAPEQVIEAPVETKSPEEKLVSEKPRKRPMIEANDLDGLAHKMIQLGFLKKETFDSLKENPEDLKRDMFGTIYRLPTSKLKDQLIEDFKRIFPRKSEVASSTSVISSGPWGKNISRDFR